MVGTIHVHGDVGTLTSFSETERDRVKVLEEDDGSGWVKISNDKTGKSGLVPASYLKLDSDEDSADEELGGDGSMAMPVPMHEPPVSPLLHSGRFGESDRLRLNKLVTGT